MAKKVTVTLVDDFDGSGAADETVEFGLDGVTYEIDLSTKNATKLRGDLKQWVAAGRRVGGRRRGRSGSAVDVARSTASRARRSANGLVVTGTMCRREAGSRPTSSTHTTRRPDIWLPAPRRKPGRRYFAAFAGGEPMAARRRKRLGGFLVYLLCGSVQRRLGALRPGTDQAPQG